MSEAEPEFLPQVLIFTGVAMIVVAFLGFFASKAESKLGLMAFTIFCVVLLVNFLIFTVLLNFGSQALQSMFEEKCTEVMPFFHQSFFSSFGCAHKYTMNATDAASLTCAKEQIATAWEANMGLVDVEEQSDFFGCLNDRCCIAMISFVKGKFNLLAAFCIVAFFFILVAIMSAQYMYKKIRKFQTRILSHKNDNWLFALMVLFTLSLGVWQYVNRPTGPRGMPQPDRKDVEVKMEYGLGLSEDGLIGIGRLGLDGWWNFERISVFQGVSGTTGWEGQVKVEVTI